MRLTHPGRERRARISDAEAGRLSLFDQATQQAKDAAKAKLLGQQVTLDAGALLQPRSRGVARRARVRSSDHDVRRDVGDDARRPPAPPTGLSRYMRCCRSSSASSRISRTRRQPPIRRRSRVSSRPPIAPPPASLADQGSRARSWARSSSDPSSVLRGRACSTTGGRGRRPLGRSRRGRRGLRSSSPGTPSTSAPRRKIEDFTASSRRTGARSGLLRAA